MRTLFAVVLFSFFGFALLATFTPSFFAVPLWKGAVTTIGIPFGLIVMFLPCLLIGVYVYRSISNYDKRIEEILREARKVTTE